jgi:hypothetical protein
VAYLIGLSRYDNLQGSLSDFSSPDRPEFIYFLVIDQFSDALWLPA